MSCSYDCSIVFYRYDGDEWTSQQRIEDAHDSTVWCCDFSADGNSLVSVGADSAVKVNCFVIISPLIIVCSFCFRARKSFAIQKPYLLNAGLFFLFVCLKVDVC